MFDFLSIAGQCKKSHRLVAYFVGCTVIMTLLVCAVIIVCQLIKYSEVSINLLDLIEIKVKR